MKRFLSVLIASVMMFSCAACSQSTDSEKNDEQYASQEAEDNTEGSDEYDLPDKIERMYVYGVNITYEDLTGDGRDEYKECKIHFNSVYVQHVRSSIDSISGETYFIANIYVDTDGTGNYTHSIQVAFDREEAMKDGDIVNIIGIYGGLLGDVPYFVLHGISR